MVHLQTWLTLGSSQWGPGETERVALLFKNQCVLLEAGFAHHWTESCRGKLQLSQTPGSDIDHARGPMPFSKENNWVYLANSCWAVCLIHNYLCAVYVITSVTGGELVLCHLSQYLDLPAWGLPSWLTDGSVSPAGAPLDSHSYPLPFLLASWINNPTASWL